MLGYGDSFIVTRCPGVRTQQQIRTTYFRRTCVLGVNPPRSEPTLAELHDGFVLYLERARGRAPLAAGRPIDYSTSPPPTRAAASNPSI